MHACAAYRAGVVAGQESADDELATLHRRHRVADGFDDADAGSLAVTCIASLEGAVVLCRSTRTAEPLREVARQVEFLIKSREFVHRFGLPSVER